jgi:Tfp pilus assembly protein PilF
VSSTPSPASFDQKTNLSLNPGGKDGILESALQREWEATKQASDEQLARRWFNAALHAQKAGEFQRAAQLAAAAATAGKSTYLYEEALLLQAKCADNLKRADSPALFARLAEERPRSEYAPVALLLAAKAARRQGDTARSEDYIRRLRTNYPRSAEAARMSRGGEYQVSNP